MFKNNCGGFACKKSLAYVFRGVNGVASFMTIDQQLKKNRGCYFPYARSAS